MVSWSADGSGLLVTDSTGGVAMWELCSLADCGEREETAAATGDAPQSPWRAVWQGACGHSQHAAEAGAAAADLAATAGSQPLGALIWAPSPKGPGCRVLRLRHPSAVLGVSWRPAPPAEGSSALLTWGGDGVGRVWLRGDDGPGSRLSFWQAAVIPMSSPLRAPPAWACSVPDAADRASQIAGAAAVDAEPPACAEAGPAACAAAGAWVAAAGLDGSLRVWAVLGLDDPPPSPTPRAFLFLHCIGALPGEFGGDAGGSSHHGGAAALSALAADTAAVLAAAAGALHTSASGAWEPAGAGLLSGPEGVASGQPSAALALVLRRAAGAHANEPPVACCLWGCSASSGAGTSSSLFRSCPCFLYQRYL